MHDRRVPCLLLAPARFDYTPSFVPVVVTARAPDLLLLCLLALGRVCPRGRTGMKRSGVGQGGVAASLQQMGLRSFQTVSQLNSIWFNAASWWCSSCDSSAMYLRIMCSVPRIRSILCRTINQLVRSECSTPLRHEPP